MTIKASRAHWERHNIGNVTICIYNENNPPVFLDERTELDRTGRKIKLFIPLSDFILRQSVQNVWWTDYDIGFSMRGPI